MKLQTKLALPLAAAFGLLTALAFSSPAHAGHGNRSKRTKRAVRYQSVNNHYNTTPTSRNNGYDWVVRADGTGYWRRASSRSYNSYGSYGYNSHGSSNSHDRAHDKFDRFDTNADDYLTWSEVHHDRLLSRQFRRIDYNDDGYISRRELRSYFRRRLRRNSGHNGHHYW